MGDVPALRLVCAARAASLLPASLTAAPSIPADLAAYVADVRRWAEHPPDHPLALQAAAACGSLEGVRWCARYISACDAAAYDFPRGCYYCFTPARALRAAAEGGHLQIVRWLLPVAAQAVPGAGEYALAGAAEAGRFAVVRWLVGKGGVTADYALRAAINAAIAHGHLPIVQWLVCAGGARLCGADLVADRDAGDVRGRIVEWLTAADSGVRWTAEQLAAAVARDRLLCGGGYKPAGLAGVVLRKALGRARGRRRAPRRRVQVR